MSRSRTQHSDASDVGSESKLCKTLLEENKNIAELHKMNLHI